MKFELDSLNFQNIAKTVSKGFIPKDIRSQIQMTVKGDSLELLAFSNKSYFKGLVPLQTKEGIEDGTSWAVDGNTFKVITDLLPSISVNISFETSESSKVFNVTAPGRKLKLNILDDKMEYPDIKINNIVDVEGYKFLYAIKNLARISDLSPNKQDNPVSALHLNFSANGLAVMGTDSHNLAEMVIKEAKTEENKTILVHATQIPLIEKSFAPNETITIIESDNMFGYKDKDDIIQLVAKTNLSPIPYESILVNIETNQETVISTSSFKEAFNALSKLSYEIKPPITFYYNFKKDGLVLSNYSGDLIDVTIDENDIEEITLGFPKDSFAKLLPMLGDKFKVNWDKSKDIQAVLVQIIGEDGEVNPDVRIAVASSKPK